MRYFNRKFTPPKPRWYAIILKREHDIEKLKELGINPTKVSKVEGSVSCSALLDSEQRAKVSKFGILTPL